MRAHRVLREARRRSGLSLRVLAQRAGTSHSTLAAYEAGEKVPSTETLDRIVRAAGFALRCELVPLDPFEDRAAHSRRVIDVLELAEALPTRHDWQRQPPSWPVA